MAPEACLKQECAAACQLPPEYDDAPLEDQGYMILSCLNENATKALECQARLECLSDFVEEASAILSPE